MIAIWLLCGCNVFALGFISGCYVIAMWLLCVYFGGFVVAMKLLCDCHLDALCYVVAM